MLSFMDSTRTLVGKTARNRPSFARAWVKAGWVRGRLTVALGLVWLLDAALQFQPFMFTRAFVTRIIEPAASGDPSIVSGPLLWAAHLMLHHIALFNGVFATTQLLIAFGLLVPRTRKVALLGSVAYALSVWWLGEGLGGVLTGASPLAGLPGGVVLYALIALLLWPAKTRNRYPAAVPAVRGLFGANGARLLWAALWGSFAFYLLLPANRGAKALAQIFTAAASGEPGWLRSVEAALANAVGSHGALISVLLALTSAFIALGIFKPSLVKPALMTAGAFGLVIWVAEAFGGIFSGTGTDPNTGPLLVLLAACYWPYRVAVAPPADEARPRQATGRDDPSRLTVRALDLREGSPAGRPLVPAGQAH
jgi:hypothetical protein